MKIRLQRADQKPMMIRADDEIRAYDDSGLDESDQDEFGPR